MSFNRKQVIEDVSKIGVSNNDHGLIDAFGVYVNRLPSNFLLSQLFLHQPDEISIRITQESGP